MGGPPVPGSKPAFVPLLHGRRPQGLQPSRLRAWMGSNCRWSSPSRVGSSCNRATPNSPRCSGSRRSPGSRCTTWPSSAVARRAGRGGLRRVGGSQDGADRGDRNRRSGRSQFPDRELPRLSHRRLGRRTDDVGPPPGQRFGAEVITTRKAVRLDAGDPGSARTIGFGTAVPSGLRRSFWPPVSITGS